MNKIIKRIKDIILSEKVNHILLDFSITVLGIMILLLLFTPSESLLAKIIVVGYLSSTMIFTLLLRISSLTTKMEFKTTSIWSFLTWNVLIAVIIGIIVGCIISKVIDIDIIESTIISTATVTMIIAMIWFGYQLFFIKSDNTAELDFYSSIIVATLTLLSLALNFNSIKIPFLIIFFIYLGIQIMIKQKICKLKKK